MATYHVQVWLASFTITALSSHVSSFKNTGYNVLPWILGVEDVMFWKLWSVVSFILSFRIILRPYRFKWSYRMIFLNFGPNTLVIKIHDVFQLNEFNNIIPFWKVFQILILYKVLVVGTIRVSFSKTIFFIWRSLRATRRF